MVHEARVIGSAWTARAKRVEMLAPTLREVRVQVLDGIELVVKIAVDQRAAGAHRLHFGSRGSQHHGLQLIQRARVGIPDLQRQLLGYMA